MVGLVFFLFILMMIGGMFALGFRQWTLAVAAWQEAAIQLGLKSASSSMFSQSSMTGRVRDLDVRVHTERRSTSGNDNKKYFTVYSVNYWADGPPVSIKREKGFGIMKRLLGTTDVQIGDPVFDDALIIDSPDAAAVTAFLTPTRRRTIFGLMETWPTAELTSTRIMVANPGLETRTDRIVSTVNRLVDTALVVGSPIALDAALELEADGDLAEGAEALAQINASPEYADNSYTRLLEAQAHLTLGDRDKVASLLDQLEPALPDDRDVMALRDMISRPAPGPSVVASSADPDLDFPAPDSGPSTAWSAPETAPAQPEPAPAQPEPVPAQPEPAPAQPEPDVPVAAADAGAVVAGATDLGAASVVADLFASDRLGHEVEGHFTDTYEGAAIRWSGAVERVRPYRGDRDFGNEPGTKLTVLIGNVGDGRLVTSRVEAIVQLPAGLEPERGSEITFTGTLIRVDRFMRNLYVADATLVDP